MILKLNVSTLCRLQCERRIHALHMFFSIVILNVYFKAYMNWHCLERERKLLGAQGRGLGEGDVQASIGYLLEPELHPTAVDIY